MKPATSSGGGKVCPTPPLTQATTQRVSPRQQMSAVEQGATSAAAAAALAAVAAATGVTAGQDPLTQVMAELKPILKVKRYVLVHQLILIWNW